jgi:hypothetical protein
MCSIGPTNHVRRLGFPLEPSINLRAVRNKRTAYFCSRVKGESMLLLNVSTYLPEGYAVAQLVEAQRYTSEGRGFDSQ